ncbi:MULTISPECIES: maleamate amidohydrolase [Sphingomonadaceae]|jgi:maleamate amidohydrolase|uniref:Maleamate amidohydrolase n=1 Tax=Sphingobium xenophagum TaxID=121428 RepID=A0A401J319_SPHXE|nr:MULTISPECIES: maleamate amidohydrolase [Sphingomonadaceae]MBS51000.1 maleamate amidohydrolase [Sphingobium sp.]MBU0657904.1 maleamate amidohydrolase [Alphaproteobacteria bacterium]MBU0775977.1 maleamate amidohydrolase [Alphaproteobacteria bacterium]MBU0868228.1 maleamate amidohydrolase [Alphaproteobacteria bacterium]MBU1257777.1 maleamate amidohydrolase [Alphaproteobacteria bacterium]|tara:strand:+ start:26708 stop:27328 length:621 start_codon:yes stop_codon:yes gene_type:complete
MSQDEVYEKAGFGGSVPRGTRPAVVVVDFTYGFTDTVYPTAADMHAQIARTRAITDLARSRGFPVIYTTIAYQPWEVETLAWLRKATGMRALLAGSRLVEIDAATGISDGDPIVEKHGASAFHGTNLAAMLTGAGVDTIVVTGATTSGCVRATVVDAVQSGFNVLVPRDCCADRANAPHEASLYDIDQKYGDVTDAADVTDWIAKL